MADPVTSSTTVEETQTPVVKPGLQTSEGKLAVIATVMSVLGMVVPTLLSMFTQIATTFPNWGWVGPIIGALGMVGAVLTALGYGQQRTALKIAALDAGSGN